MKGYVAEQAVKKAQHGQNGLGIAHQVCFALRKNIILHQKGIGAIVEPGVLVELVVIGYGCGHQIRSNGIAVFPVKNTGSVIDFLIQNQQSVSGNLKIRMGTHHHIQRVYFIR